MAAMFKNIGIDMGSSKVAVCVSNGETVSVPSDVMKMADTGEIVSLGEKNSILGLVMANAVTVKAIKGGEVADAELAEMMIKAVAKKALVASSARGIHTAMIALSLNMNDMNKMLMMDIISRIGARNTVAVPSIIAAAYGAGRDVFSNKGTLAVDIGANKTDMAMITMGGIVSSKSISVGSFDINAQIIRFIKEKKKLIIGENIAEEIKKEIVDVFFPSEKKMKIRGRCTITGMPKESEIVSKEMFSCLRKVAQKIADAVKELVVSVPPELTFDMVEQGIILTGGGSLLKGMEKLIEKSTHLKVFLDNNAENSVAKGMEFLLINEDKQRILQTFNIA